MRIDTEKGEKNVPSQMEKVYKDYKIFGKPPNLPDGICSVKNI